MTHAPPGREVLREALKRVAVALKQTGRPFALMGGYAAWARGGPESVHDVDFLVADEDAAAVRESLVEQGLEVIEPPEDWLFKISSEGVIVDIIHRATGRPASRQVLEEADELEVLSVAMPVLSATEIMLQKMHALNEHYCDLSEYVPVARALREQVDWSRVRTQTSGNPYAGALLYLLERIEVVEQVSV